METAGMARQSRYEYLRVMWQRYQTARGHERSAILDEVVQMCGYHCRHVIRVLSRRTPPRPPVRRVGRRRATYSAEIIERLAQIWEVSGYLCGVRLKAALPTWLPWLRCQATLTPALEAQLRQIDRRLREGKQRITRRIYG